MKELKHYRDMSSHRNSAATGVNYWEGKMLEAVVADECETIIDDLMVGKKGADQNTNKSVRTACRRLFIAAALAFKVDITRAVSLKLKHLVAYDSEEDARMALIGAHRVVLAGITAVVLHDHDLRFDNLDDLDSVVSEMKVVVLENGDLDCVRKSPEEGEGSKASELLKRIQSEPSDIEALRNLLALATAKKNGSEAIDLTDDTNNDPPQQSPNQASDSVAVKVKVEIKVEDESPPAVFLDRLANDAPPDLPAGAPAGPIGGELVPNLGVAVREAASAAGQTSPMEVDSGKKAKRGRPYGSTRKNKTDVAKLAAWERMIFVKPVSNDTARPTDYTTENMKIWAESMLDASPNKEETQKKKLQMAQEFLLFLQTHPSTALYRVSAVAGVRGSDGCEGAKCNLRGRGGGPLC